MTIKLPVRVELTQARLREVLHYDPQTGIFVWLRPGRSGDKAGNIDRGYRKMMVDGYRYKACRLAWLYVHGRWPKQDTDHINGVKDDDRLSNLREATHAQNLRAQGIGATNKTGFRGVNYERGKFRARLELSGKQVFLGYFTTAAEAGEVARLARIKHYGEFAGRNDRP